jgi:hypothetical protein
MITTRIWELSARAIVAADWHPAVMREHEAPKDDDKRRAVEVIVAASPEGSTVIALGRNRSWLLDAIGCNVQRRSA